MSKLVPHLHVSCLFKHHLVNKEKIWLHHCRLGHPSFGTLKIVFLFLFRKLDVESFHYDVCKLVKHRRLTFLTKNNERSSESFHIIHSDFWGPSFLFIIYLGHISLCLLSMIVLSLLDFLT